MNTNYRKTLIAAAVAALISAPAWSATDAPGSSTDAAQSRDSQSQSQGAYKIGGEISSPDGAARAKASDNPLYSRTPDDLNGLEVIGSDGDSIGKIKSVVMDRNRDDVHAVITSGGIMGLGARETVVSLDELKLVGDDKVEANLTEESLKSRPEYKAEQYGELQSNQPISEFSAFEPTTSPSDQSSSRAGSDTSRSATGVQRSGAGSADATSSQQSSSRSGSDSARSPVAVQGSGTASPDSASSQQSSSRAGSDSSRSAVGVQGSGKGSADSASSQQATPRAGSDTPRSAMGTERSGAAGAGDMPSQMSSRSEMSANPLHRRTPKDLQGMEVIGSDGEDIGKVKAIVASKNRDQVHAVISSGGFLGLATREILVPLDELKVVGDKQLQTEFKQDSIESRPVYHSREYGELESDRPISEFSAFEPMKGKDGPAGKDQAPAKDRTPR
ncbi:MAG: PRC-barrel domain-containing protein [Thioalkalivibrio sp.]